MEPKKRTCLLLAALLSLSGVQPAVAADYQAADYLPLAVGNSWTYEHIYLDREEPYHPGVGYYPQWPTYRAQWPEEPQFTITVERTEVIDGKTYYVLSAMPTGWPPAGRWNGFLISQEGKEIAVSLQNTAKTHHLL